MSSRSKRIKKAKKQQAPFPSRINHTKSKSKFAQQNEKDLTDEDNTESDPDSMEDVSDMMEKHIEKDGIENIPAGDSLNDNG